MTVALRYANTDDRPRILRFLADHWSADNIYVRRPELFDWTFAGRPGLWDRDGYSFALAESGDELVGILGAIPFALDAFGERAPALWLSNFMIRADHRRGALALKLIGMMRREPYRATIGFGIASRTAPLYQALRWQVLDDIPRHFFALPETRERLVALIGAAHTAWPSERARDLAAHFVSDTWPAPTTAEAATDLPADWQPDFAARRMIGAARDHAYFTWRYRHHPLFTYRFLAVREEERTGLLVWRLEEIRRAERHPKVFDCLERIGRVVEFLPASLYNARELLAHLRLALQQTDAVGADFYCYHGELRRWLAALGVRETQSHPDGARLPARFQPLDVKPATIVSSLFLPDAVPAVSLAADCAWYWTKSDADQDRPN